MKKLIWLFLLLLWGMFVNAQTSYTYDSIETKRMNKHDTVQHFFNKKGTIVFVNKYPNKYYIVIDRDIYYYRNNKAIQAYDSCCNYYKEEVVLWTNDGINIGLDYWLYREYKDNKLINIIIKRKNYYKWYKNIKSL